MTREDLLKQSPHVWLQVCPKCRQLWVIGDAQADDRYRCKTCGRDFVIGYEHLPSSKGEAKVALLRQ